MKLKYYLRGLGIGILVTALIMTVASGKKGTMTDEEIIQRAMELGMVASSKTLISQQENLTETEQVVTPTLEPKETPTEEIIEMPSEEATLAPVEQTMPPDELGQVEEPVESFAQEPEITLAPTQVPTQAPADSFTQGETVTLTIYSGEHSAAVARRMEDLGLVEDYLDFDDYLCDNGYSRYVNSGIYKIKQGLSYEELAKIITRTN